MEVERSDRRTLRESVGRQKIVGGPLGPLLFAHVVVHDRVLELENLLEWHPLCDKVEDRLDVLDREDAAEDLTLHSCEGGANESGAVAETEMRVPEDRL